MSKPKYKAVIFDFDDTLAESWKLKWAHHKETAKTFYGIELTDEDIKDHYGKPMDEMLVALYRAADTLENMYKNLISIRDRFLKKVFDGSVETVTKLIDQGVLVGVVSATKKQYLLEDLERMQFPVQKFFHIQASDDTEVHKPHPDVFLPVLEKLSKMGVEKNQIVYVGDSIRDLQAAHGAGIDFIAITTGLHSRKEFKDHGATVVVDNITEVADKIL